MICLDTTFILDLLKKKPDSIVALKSLSGKELASTEINYFEVLFGVFKKKEFSQHELDLVQEFFSSIKLLPLNSSGAYNASEIGGGLSRKGLTIGSHDVLIAGICLANNCETIITKDVKHFSRIKGLKVESY